MEKTLSSRYVFEGRALNVREDTVLTPDGRRTTREVVEHEAVVAMVALDENANLIMVEQYRYALGDKLLEIPAGGINPGETQEAAVRREMQEETGLLPRRLKRLGGFYAVAGYGNEYLHVYLAEDFVPSQLHAEDTDDITVVKVPLSEARQLIASGAIQDAKSIAGMMLYLENRD